MSAMSDEERRIRSYLEAQGAKLTPAQIVEKVRAAMTALYEAAAAVPGARFHDRPAPGEWSANEVMAHVCDAGVHFAEGIVRVLDGAAPAPRAARPAEETPPRRSLDEWWRRLVSDRSTLIARVLAADPGAHLEQSIDHGMFGALNWRETLLFLRVHDLDHAGQLQKIAAALRQ
jgi:uncharacterized damage-inducible protein DinB